MPEETRAWKWKHNTDMALLRHLLDRAVEDHREYDYDNSLNVDQAARRLCKQVAEGEAIVISRCGGVPAKVIVLDI